VTADGWFWKHWLDHSFDPPHGSHQMLGLVLWVALNMQARVLCENDKAFCLVKAFCCVFTVYPLCCVFYLCLVERSWLLFDLVRTLFLRRSSVVALNVVLWTCAYIWAVVLLFLSHAFYISVFQPLFFFHIWSGIGLEVFKMVIESSCYILNAACLTPIPN